MDTYSYQKLDDIENIIEFEKFPYVQSIFKGFIGLLFSNKPKFIYSDELKKATIFNDENVIKAIQDIAIEAGKMILPKVIVFGFFFFRKKKTKTKKIGIEIINFENGNAMYKIDRENKLVELGWFWDTTTATDSNISLNNKSFLQDYFSSQESFRDYFHPDPEVMCFVEHPPTFKGSLTTGMSFFVKEYQKLKHLEENAMKIEDDKASNRFYAQRNLPVLKEDSYEMLQNHAFYRNANMNDIDTDDKRHRNMYGLKDDIQIFGGGGDWKKKTEEMIVKNFRIQNFFSITKDENGIIHTGELINLVYPKIQNYGRLYELKRNELKEVIAENLGFMERSTSGKNLKDRVRLIGFLIRPSLKNIQITMEKALTSIMNFFIYSYFKDIINIYNIESNNPLDINNQKERKRKRKKSPEEKMELDDIPEYLKVELDPIQYLTGDELDMFIKNKISLKILIRMTMGSEFEDFFKDRNDNVVGIDDNKDKNDSDEKESESDQNKEDNNNTNKNKNTKEKN